MNATVSVHWDMNIVAKMISSDSYIRLKIASHIYRHLGHNSAMVCTIPETFIFLFLA